MNVNEIQNPSSSTPKRRRNPVYSFLTSMKAGVILLLVFTLACILGTIVPQGEPPELYREHFGTFFGNFFINTGLANVFGSWWFNFLAVVIGISMSLCSWRRLHGLMRASEPQVEVSRERIEQMKAHATFVVALGRTAAVERTAQELRKRGYGARRQNSPEAVSFFAVKGRLADWGTFAVHISLLIIMIGAIYGNMPSIRGVWQGRSYSADAPLMAGERFTVTPPKTPSFEIELEKSQAETDALGMPTAYRSWVRVYENGKEVKSGLIEMNRPVYYQGVSMTMSQYLPPHGGEFEPDLRLLVKIPGAKPQEIPIPLIDSPEGFAIDMMSTITVVPAKGWKVFTHSFFAAALDKNGAVALGEDGKPREVQENEAAVPALSVFVVENPSPENLQGWERVGYVGPAAEVDYKGVKFILEDRTTAKPGKSVAGAVLSLHKDPGIPILYVGFTILTLGVTLAFYISHRTLRVRLWEEKGRTWIAAGVRSRGGLAWAETELERLRSGLSSGKSQ